MSLPPAYHPVWANLVTGKLQHPLKFLAAKIMLGRLIRRTAIDPSPETIQDCCLQIRDIYERHLGLPTVTEDLENFSIISGSRS
jgi:hypothetical protein